MRKNCKGSVMNGVRIMGKFQDLSGNKYGKLTVIKAINEKQKPGCHKKWLCKCECGNTTIVSADHLKKGDTKSCGCYFHGLSKTRLYNIWGHMKSRCYDPADQNYKYYGKRGITICDEWKYNFSEFYKWAVNNGYSEKLTIDRIDNNARYSPSNCRWTTKKIQANNTRWNHKVNYNGEEHNIAEWAIITGIKANTIIYRLRRGWSIERALTEGVKR